MTDPNVGWMADGACRRVDPELFYHPVNERGESARQRDAYAKAVCGNCPVAAQCLAYALEAREPYGVWGGLTEEERAKLLKHDGRLMSGRGHLTDAIRRMWEQGRSDPEIAAEVGMSSPGAVMKYRQHHLPDTVQRRPTDQEIRAHATARRSA